MDGFLRHVSSGKNHATGQIGMPTDFLAFHAKGDPKFVDGHVRIGLDVHLRGVNSGFDKTLSTPLLASKPIAIGESDPRAARRTPVPRTAIATAPFTPAIRRRPDGALRVLEDGDGGRLLRLSSRRSA